jgi:hypothetical protein
MAIIFDTLGYANHLKRAGVEPRQAEAHAEAIKGFVMHEIVTQKDLEAFGKQLELTLTLNLTLRLGAIMVASTVVIAGLVALLK